MHNLVSVFVGKAGAEDENQSLDQLTKVQGRPNDKNAGNMSACCQMISEMARHAGAIVSDKPAIVIFQPTQQNWVRR